MVLGVGIDILDLSRLEKSIGRHPRRFVEKIFSPAEREYCLARKTPLVHLGGRFAAKEAFLKALGRDRRDGITWQEIEIPGRAGSPPGYRLHGRAGRAVACLLGSAPAGRPVPPPETCLRLSISHSGGYAAAICIIDSGPPPPPATGPGHHEGGKK